MIDESMIRRMGRVKASSRRVTQRVKSCTAKLGALAEPPLSARLSPMHRPTCPHDQDQGRQTAEINERFDSHVHERSLGLSAQSIQSRTTDLHSQHRTFLSAPTMKAAIEDWQYRGPG